jgi:uncharacterized protein
MFMLLTLIGLPLIYLPQWWVKKTISRYEQQPISIGLTGLEIATRILQQHGINDVQVESVEGTLSDHYDPSSKTVRLSLANYTGKTVSSTAIAAHEVGHALQHAADFAPVLWRSAMVPAVNLGSQLGPMLIFGSVILGSFHFLAPEMTFLVGCTGIVFFGLSVLFHLVTLPVELDASARAIKILSEGGYLTTQEVGGAKQVLSAAAMTYVATALYSLMQLMYYSMQVFGSSRRSN